MKTKLWAVVSVAVLSLFADPSLARAERPAAAAVSPGARPEAADLALPKADARAQPSMNDTYAARETKASGLAKFQGGDRVVIAGSTLAVVLLIVLIIVLI